VATPWLPFTTREQTALSKIFTKEAGLTRLGWGMGVAVADYDNDGKLDLFVHGYNGNVLYHNLGNCKFEDVTEKGRGSRWRVQHRRQLGAITIVMARWTCFVARYSHLDMDNPSPVSAARKFCRFKGLLVQCGPWGLEANPIFFTIIAGDGTFEEVSVKAGVPR